MEIVRQLLVFVVLCIVQVLVLNHINLLGCATPLLYIYFIMSFRRDYPRWCVLLWSFCLGICIDIFSNTPGVAASSATFLGFVQPLLLGLFVQRDSPDDLKPAMRTLGVVKYMCYAFVCVFIFNILFFTLESFSFFNWLQWAKNIGGSTVLTLLLVLAIENLRKR